MVRDQADESKQEAGAGAGNGLGPQDLAHAHASEPPDDAVSATVPSAEAAEPQEAATIEEQLVQARQQADEYLELAQRARAELINFKRRVEREQHENRRYAIVSLVVDLLPVMDSSTQALDTFANESDRDNPLLAGLRRTAAQFEQVLAKYGVTRIGESGIPFNSELHQPLHSEESDDVSVETVAEVYRPGVKIGDRVLRPASVKVLVPKAESELGSTVEEGDEVS